MIKENGKIQPSECFIAAPDPGNIQEWYFVIFSIPDDPYTNGYYMGKLTFPKEYPYKPPSIMMVTETGRFEVHQRICLSISDFHPESWNPLWPIPSIIVGLISFMTSNKVTAGAIFNYSRNEIKRIAKDSKAKLA